MKGFRQKVKIISFIIIASNIQIYAQGVLDIETKDLNGQISSIGQVVSADFIVLDFWATWCKPCVKSIPKLVELSEKYSTDKVAFVGINEDSPRNTNKVKPFVRSLNISYPILLDPDQEIMNELLVNSFPTLIIVNSDARVLYVHEGYTSGDEVIIEEAINKLLKKHD